MRKKLARSTLSFWKKITRKYFRHDFTYLFILETRNEGKRGDQSRQGRRRDQRKQKMIRIYRCSNSWDVLFNILWSLMIDKKMYQSGKEQNKWMTTDPSLHFIMTMRQRNKEHEYYWSEKGPMRKLLDLVNIVIRCISL